MSAQRIKTTLWVMLIFIVFLNVATWLYARDIKTRWLNVPPAPGIAGASALTLGDQKFAYRVIGIMLQNMGDTGGRTTNLKEYDYQALSGWFYLAEKLDPRSDFVPTLAAYYFGAIEDPQALAPLVEYLHHAGSSVEGQKWRWLAQAVYLARFKMNDLDKAYELAQELAALDNPDMPVWTRQMPAFVLTARGDKEAAYAIMLEILRSSAEKLDPAEVNASRHYICTRILDETEAKDDPLCENIP